MQSLRRTPYEDGFPEPDDPPGSSGARRRSRPRWSTISPELDAPSCPPRYTAAGAASSPTPTTRSPATCPPTLPAPRPLDGPPRVVYQGTLSTNGGHYDLRDLFAAIADAGGVPRRLPGARRPRVPRDPRHPRPRTRCRRPTCCASCGLRLRLGRLQHRPQRRPPRHRAAEQALRVPRLRAAGAHAPPPRAAADAARERRRHRARRRRPSSRRRWRTADVAALRRRVAETRERFTVESQIHRIAALYADVAAGAGGGLERTATAAG